MREDSFGRAPNGDGDETFGTAPDTPGGPKPAPRPAPTGSNRNVAVMVGIVVAALAILAAIVGLVMR